MESRKKRRRDVANKKDDINEDTEILKAQDYEKKQFHQNTKVDVKYDYSRKKMAQTLMRLEMKDQRKKR